jgi:hypothetical protein
VPTERGQNRDPKIGEFDLAFRRVRLRRFDDGVGFGGAAGIEQASRHAGIVAHAGLEAMLGRAIGVDVTLGIRDVGERVDQLPLFEAASS